MTYQQIVDQKVRAGIPFGTACAEARQECGMRRVRFGVRREHTIPAPVSREPSRWQHYGFRSSRHGGGQR